MLERIIRLSLDNKLAILLLTVAIIAYGLYAITKISIGAVPDVTNNQVQVITTSRNLSTADIEKYITYPVELEMANLPGVKEIRSISKFGLSVVTVVFEDRMGTYLPRQLIAEKIKTASGNIPESFGTPTIGPISTGLGEIYQYTLEVDSAYKDQYTTTELRTIQDWIVKRQLSGIPGVVEVNTWGGHLKQLEVTINPERLKALNLSMHQVFQALAMNNSIAGGGYIEKDDQAYFIRGEGAVSSLADIGHIVVDVREGIPIYVKDIAEVNTGFATRFGAITGNGEGEKVLGQVMMLKGANVKEVITAVKARVNTIQSTLPPGITINGFLERSELIGRTTHTITENLILGCLIVIFAVILLLGDIRTGLIIASVIPISLLFAISLMYLFGVDANLMSMGAIDFGIIIDGSIIIVEYVVYQIQRRHSEISGLPQNERQPVIDKITFEASSKMMHSAFFGQLIIIIVFIPILTLRGVEGKMFIPMAMTFCFALLGAMLLCVTYVPVITTYLARARSQTHNWSDKFITQLQSIYQPLLTWALDYRKTVLVFAAALLLGAFFIFTRLGGEFVPTLDEGDFVIQPVLETGTSLSKTIEITTAIERVIKQFPEVEQVVTRIGAAEIPTDPMSMEETDVIITLQPKSAWTSANSKNALADLIKAELIRQIPNVDYEFTQPIEMRFNELITGVRADLAIKVYGEDLHILTTKAEAIRELITPIEGASDITIEKVEGLPQMLVDYDRSKIARYGLNISDVNDVITAGFAGTAAGSIFEGERKFDLVLRYGEGFRQDLNDIKNATITNAHGLQIPLKELANIRYTEGPAKISRDNTQRRIVVGVNIRNRDMESVVKDAQRLIEANITLPVGYTISYGGQFENLRNARERLTFAVPLALLLIFSMLFFAFRSIKEALLVFTAIPLAAIGGVLLMWIRGLPFSISAGVGFIALFGIAVLNGIVLIAHYKSLLHTSSTANLKDIIIEGTKQRMRPVLLTASAAALGFLPMAVSTSAGAEVQRPLATVVIGGLITATLLTLLVLPTLYYLTRDFQTKIKFRPKAMVISLLLLTPICGLTQGNPMTLEEVTAIGKANNLTLKAKALEVKQSELKVKTAFDLNNTQVYYSYDENNIAPNDNALNVWGVGQVFEFPITTIQEKKLLKRQSELSREEYDMQERILENDIRKAFYTLAYHKALLREIQALDSLIDRFAHAAKRRFELGEVDYVSYLSAVNHQEQIHLDLLKTEKNTMRSYLELRKLLLTEQEFDIEYSAFFTTPTLIMDTASYLGQAYYRMQELTADQAFRHQKSKYAPEIQLELFTGSNGSTSTYYNGIQIGLGLPLFSSSQRVGSQVMKLEQEKTTLRSENYEVQMRYAVEQLMEQIDYLSREISYFNATGKALNEKLIDAATKSYEHGEIGAFQFTQIFEQSRDLKTQYLSTLHSYHLKSSELRHLTNQ